MWGNLFTGALRLRAALKLAMAAGLAVFAVEGPGTGREARADLAPLVLKQAFRAAERATPTRAWVEFCLRLPAECRIDETELGTIPLTLATWNLLVAVNERVNRTIKAMPDLEHWGIQDRWDYPDDGIGDCEDIQLLKRRLLAEAGLSRRALRMAVVFDEMGDGHAVLMALTDRGALILDNKRDAVLPWNRTSYTYLKREGSDGTAWASLVGRLAPVADDVAAGLREQVLASAPETSALLD